MEDSKLIKLEEKAGKHTLAAKLGSESALTMFMYWINNSSSFLYGIYKPLSSHLTSPRLLHVLLQLKTNKGNFYHQLLRHGSFVIWCWSRENRKRRSHVLHPALSLSLCERFEKASASSAGPILSLTPVPLSNVSHCTISNTSRTWTALHFSWSYSTSLVFMQMNILV